MTLCSPVAPKKSNKKLPTDSAIFLRDSSSALSKENIPQGRAGAVACGIFDEDRDELVHRKVATSGKTSSPCSDLPAGKAKVQKLDGSTYRPFGSHSRSSSEAGSVCSDTLFCKVGPGKPVCGDPVKNSECGVSCDRCESWFHAACRAFQSQPMMPLQNIKY